MCVHTQGTVIYGVCDHRLQVEDVEPCEEANNGCNEILICVACIDLEKPKV